MSYASVLFHLDNFKALPHLHSAKPPSLGSGSESDGEQKEEYFAVHVRWSCVWLHTEEICGRKTILRPSSPVASEQQLVVSLLISPVSAVGENEVSDLRSGSYYMQQPT